MRAGIDNTFRAINAACGELPEGYILSLKAENGAAWVEVATPDGVTLKGIDETELTLPEQIRAGINAAILHNGPAERQQGEG